MKGFISYLLFTCTCKCNGGLGKQEYSYVYMLPDFYVYKCDNCGLENKILKKYEFVFPYLLKFVKK